MPNPNNGFLQHSSVLNPIFITQSFRLISMTQDVKKHSIVSVADLSETEIRHEFKNRNNGRMAKANSVSITRLTTCTLSRGEVTE